MLLDSWPKDIPRIYPKAKSKALVQFLTLDQYCQLLEWPVVDLLPLVAEKRNPLERAFGAGLACVIRRDLMLVTGIGITPPEHNSALWYENVYQRTRETSFRPAKITGYVKIRRGVFDVRLRFLFTDGKVKQTTIQGNQLMPLLDSCVATVGNALGGNVNAQVVEAWKLGRPCDFQSISRLGSLLLSDLSRKEKSNELVNLWIEDCKFTAPLTAMDHLSQPGATDIMLESLTEHDPFNAQVCLQLYQCLARKDRQAPEATQFLRKAIELSPGYGHAHQLLATAAPASANALRHAELAYQLLPGDPQVINSYLKLLLNAGKPADEIMFLANEGIECNPKDPSSYVQMIELLESIGDVRGAMGVANRLQQLLEPQIDPDARRCLMRNPEIRHALATGNYDPAYENRKRIHRLESLLSS